MAKHRASFIIARIVEENSKRGLNRSRDFIRSREYQQASSICDQINWLFIAVVCSLCNFAWRMELLSQSSLIFEYLFCRDGGESDPMTTIHARCDLFSSLLFCWCLSLSPVRPLAFFPCEWDLNQQNTSIINETKTARLHRRPFQQEKHVNDFSSSSAPSANIRDGKIGKVGSKNGLQQRIVSLFFCSSLTADIVRVR